ncbi:carbohydrate porin, partial [Bacteroidota bacterium]
ENPLTFEAGYVSDIVSNFSGGIKTGSTYLGNIDLAVTLNTESAGLWKSGELFLNMQNTHGGTPTADLVGDLQVFDNIENGGFSYLYQLFYKHSIGKLSVLVGKHDLNAEFFTSDYAGEYINSTFGIMSLAPLNVPVSIFPKTSLGAIIKYDLWDGLAIQAAVYDGDPLDLDADPYSTDFKVNSEEGYMSFIEVHANTVIGSLPGTYKLGSFHHSADFADCSDSMKSHNGNLGAYIIADQMVYKEADDSNQGLGLLFQTGIAPCSKNLNDFYLAFGLNYYGLFPGRDEDVLGIAIAHASISNDLVKNDPDNILKHETVIEFVYGATIHENIAIKPNLQYIINPGADASLSNALAGILRFEISF